MSVANEPTESSPNLEDPEPVLTPVLHHVNLKTTRKAEMVAWYGTVCGMKVNYDGPLGAFLSNDGASHRLALLEDPVYVPDPERRTRVGFHHSAFEFDSLADLDATYRRLQRAGIEPLLCVDHRIAVSYYYEDPDGNIVEMQCDGFGSWEASTRWMKTELPNVTEYPLGIIIDPALVSKDVLEGMTRDEMLERSESGRYRWDGEPDLRLPPPPADSPAMFMQ